MNAAGVIAEALNTEIVGNSGDRNGGRLSYGRSHDLAVQGLCTLRDAGYAVVGLPESLPDGWWPDAGKERWFVHVEHGGRIVAESEEGCYEFDALQSRSLAAALLAAADAAEVRPS